jgi:nicotinamidase-related amidase
MSAPALVVVDMQEVFAEPGGPWGAPRFGETLAPIEALIDAFAPRVVFTRFVAPAEPAGAWSAYYEAFPFALQPPEADLYRVVARLAPHATAGTLDATTMSKWGPELAEAVGPGGEMVLAGVSTEACVLGTALAAADAGVRVRVAADACAGANDAVHEAALGVMRIWGPLIEVAASAEIIRASDPLLERPADGARDVEDRIADGADHAVGADDQHGAS